MNLNDNIKKHNINNALKHTDSPQDKSKKLINYNNYLTNNILLNKIQFESSLKKKNDLSFNNPKNLKSGKFQEKPNISKNKIVKIPDRDKENEELKNSSFIDDMNTKLKKSNIILLNNKNNNSNNNILKNNINKQESSLDKTISANTSKQILFRNNTKINPSINDKLNNFMKIQEKNFQGNNQIKGIKANIEKYKQSLSKKSISNLKSKFTNKSYSELLTTNLIYNETLASTASKNNQNQQKVYSVLDTNENLVSNDKQAISDLVKESEIKIKNKSENYNSLNENLNLKSKKLDFNTKNDMSLDFQKQFKKVEDNNNNSKEEIEQQSFFNKSIQIKNYKYLIKENNDLLNNEKPIMISKKEVLKKRKNSKNKLNESLRKINEGCQSLIEAKVIENHLDKIKENNSLIKNYCEYKNLNPNNKIKKKLNLCSKNNLTFDYDNTIKENFGISNDFDEESPINETIIKKDLIHNNVNKEYIANNNRSDYKSTNNEKNNKNCKKEKEIKFFDIKTENTKDEVFINIDDLQCENFDFIEYDKEKNFEFNSSNDLIDFNKKRFTNNNNTNYGYEKNLINNQQVRSMNDLAHGISKNNNNLWTKSSYLPNKKYLDFMNEELLNLNTQSYLIEKIDAEKKKLNYFFTDSQLNIDYKSRFLNKKIMKLFFHKKENKFINTIKNEVDNNNEIEKNLLSDFKFKSSSNLVKNPLINKHIGSRILTLNSENEEKTEKSDENESSIIDSDYLEEDQKMQKSKSNIRKNSLKNIDINITSEKLTPDDKKISKLNYHRKKNLNLEGNSGGLTAKYLPHKKIRKSKKDYEESNLLKKFSLWKTIDNEITNNNLEDMNKTLKILQYFIEFLKKECNHKKTKMKQKIENLEKANLNLKLENKTLHQEIKTHKSTIYNIFKRSIDFEHNKIIEDKEILLIINKLLKENEFLRKILNDGNVYSNNNNYEGAFNRLLNNPLAKLNNLNFDEKINSMILNNKHLLKRNKSEDSIKMIQSCDKILNKKIDTKCELQNENFNTKNLISEFDSVDNDIDYDANVNDLISLKNIRNLVNISNDINCDLFNQKFLTKSSRNFNKENQIIAENFNINHYKIINKENSFIEKKSSQEEIKKILNNPSLDTLKKTKSRNDNSKLDENFYHLNKINKVEFEKNIKSRTNKGIIELIKIEDQELEIENQNNIMDITVIESHGDKIFTNEDLLSKVNSNENDLIQIDFHDTQKINSKQQDYIYAFENEFVNELKNIVNIDSKQLNDSIFSQEKREEFNNKNLYNIIVNEKKKKVNNFNNKQIENFSLIKESQHLPSQKLNQSDKAEYTTNEKNESTNFTTDIKLNVKCEEKNNELIEKFLYFKNNYSLDFGNQVTFDEKNYKEILTNSINEGENDKSNTSILYKNSTLNSNSNIEVAYLLSFTPRETNNKKF